MLLAKRREIFAMALTVLPRLESLPAIPAAIHIVIFRARARAGKADVRVGSVVENGATFGVVCVAVRGFAFIVDVLKGSRLS